MTRAACVPVLAYHAMRVGGAAYADNDHAGFAADLLHLHALGLAVVPLREVALAAIEGRLESLRGCVALSFDDGADFDVHDLPHPGWGPQRGMLGILRDFRARHGREAQPRLHATSFAIVSRAARDELDRTSMVGCRWWNDDWWPEAEASGLLAVESHSWDHNHATLRETACAAPAGTFDLATREDADAQVARASHWLCERRGRSGPVLFAYPYGPASRYLAEEYLPDARADHGVLAAFTTDGAPVSPGACRWRLPRYVFGWHWRSPGDLERLLADGGALPAKTRATGGRAPARASPPPSPADAVAPGLLDRLRAWEVNDPSVVAAPLLAPGAAAGMARHVVLVLSPETGAADPSPVVVAYAGIGAGGQVDLLRIDPSLDASLAPRDREALAGRGGIAGLAQQRAREALLPRPTAA